MINKKIASELAVGMILILAFLIAGIFWMEKTNEIATNDQKQTTNELHQLSKENVISEKETSRKYEPVIIYSEEVKTADDKSRLWPTVRIYRKVANQQPEMLAEVGKVGEYPNSYKLSPDRKNLLINLESKLQILDLKTKELSDLFVSKKEVLDVAYSPDSKKLFIWDQKYASEDKDYFVHILDLNTKESKIIAQGKNSSNVLFPGVWRDDDKVTLAEAFGEISLPYYFNLSDNKISKVSEVSQVGATSRSGKIMIISDSNNDVEDVCNGFSGSGPSTYNVVDPIDGKKMGTVGVKGKIVEISAVSPNDNEILLKAGKPWVNREDCNKKIANDFYRANISTGKVEKVTNISELLKSWDTEYVGAEYNHDQKDEILLNGEVLVESNKNLTLISQFYN